jgi:hypothetical protein
VDTAARTFVPPKTPQFDAARQVNECVRELEDRLIGRDPAEPIAFACECGCLVCGEWTAVVLTAAEYDLQKSSAIVAEGHGASSVADDRRRRFSSRNGANGR